VFIGPGLLRLSRSWRACALLFLWIAMIAAPIIVAFLFTASGTLDLKLFGQKIGQVSPVYGIPFTISIFALTVWQYRVLTSPEVRSLFETYDGRL
jgi:hypothetical protein